MWDINQFSAQCVYTASESNREAVILLSLSNHKAVLERFIQQKTGDNTDLILLRTLLTGLSDIEFMYFHRILQNVNR